MTKCGTINYDKNQRPKQYDKTQTANEYYWVTHSILFHCLYILIV